MSAKKSDALTEEVAIHIFMIDNPRSEWRGTEKMFWRLKAARLISIVRLHDKRAEARASQ